MQRPVMESLFNKVATFPLCNFIKKRLQHRCIPVNTVKFLRTLFPQKPPGDCVYDR